MKTTNFNWGDNLLDSRDLIARAEELTDELASYEEEVDNINEELDNFYIENPHTELHTEVLMEYSSDLLDSLEEAKLQLSKFIEENLEEIDLLSEVIEQGQDSPDWSYGETLIHENYFTDYIKELIDDCYEMPKEFDDGKWPFNHLNFDFEGAAEEAKSDYIEINAGGETYFIRA